MKLEVILNGIGSITVEDEVNHAEKVMRKLTTFALDELRRAVPPGKRIGFEASSGGQLENNAAQDPDPREMPGVIVR